MLEVIRADYNYIEFLAKISNLEGDKVVKEVNPIIGRTLAGHPKIYSVVFKTIKTEQEVYDLLGYYQFPKPLSDKRSIMTNQLSLDFGVGNNFYNVSFYPVETN